MASSAVTSPLPSRTSHTGRPCAEIGRSRTSSVCWAMKGRAESQGSNASAGWRREVRTGRPRPAAMAAALTADAFQTLAFGMRISKWQVRAGALGVAAVAQVGDVLALADLRPTARPGAKACLNRFAPSSVPGVSLLMWR